MRPSGPPLRTLAIIRVALLTGILLLGGAFWMVRKDNPPPMPSVETMQSMRIIFLVLAATAVGGVAVIQGMVQRVPAERRASLSFVAWAIAEAPALFGAVRYFQTGDPRSYYVGTFIFIAALLLVPLRTRD